MGGTSIIIEREWRKSRGQTEEMVNNNLTASPSRYINQKVSLWTFITRVRNSDFLSVNSK